MPSRPYENHADIKDTLRRSHELMSQWMNRKGRASNAVRDQIKPPLTRKPLATTIRAALGHP
jgi:hypothetical protein